MHQDAEGAALAPESLSPPDLVLAVVGPTASGKTDLALALARRLGGEVLSADMGQLYRRLDAGTAKPPTGSVHLVDVLDPGQLSDAGTYARLAEPVLEDIAARGKLPIVAGGTGFYVQALLEGLPTLPSRDPVLRAALEERGRREGVSALYAELAKRDPEGARRVDGRNMPRVVRALELLTLTGAPLPPRPRRGTRRTRWRAVYVALERPRAELRARIKARAERMFPAMIEEVRRLVPASYRGDEPGFRCLGYSQALACARGELDQGAGLAAMVNATNAYARRQMTWFRRQVIASWLAPETAEAAAADIVHGAA